MKSISQLRQILLRIDRKGYKAYKDIQGEYEGDGWFLFIDHVQGDPFASPSKIRIRVPLKLAKFPPELFQTRVRAIAFADYLARCFRTRFLKEPSGVSGTGKSGMVFIDAGGQEVLERTAVLITPEWVEVRLQIGLPAIGRTVLGKKAIEILSHYLPRISKEVFNWAHLPQEEVTRFVECIENQEYIRSQLPGLGLIAFIANHAILPRKSGISDEPMAAAQAIPFQSPNDLTVSITVPNEIPGVGFEISGMGIPEGVTLIVGGGYHGKSTLLKALERGVYPHIPGDGREYVVSTPEMVKIRAEDGRYIEKVDISPFITNIPHNRSTKAFCSDDASGSTSQAANIMEALEVGAKVLLVDEDTSATNFMIRDARMQKLVHKEEEPITPFVDRVKELYEKLGVSTILVIGGSGDYLDVADQVIQMKEYIPLHVTSKAREVCRLMPSAREKEVAGFPLNVTHRIPARRSFNPSRGKKLIKIDVKGKDTILFGKDVIDLRYLEQIVDTSQTRAIGFCLHLISEKFMDEKTPLTELLNRLENFLNTHGLDALDPFHRGEGHPGNFARPRRFEIAAALNRLRTLKIKQLSP